MVLIFYKKTGECLNTIILKLSWINVILEQLLQNYYDNLLTKATYENHAMYHLLPTFKSTCYNLRSHGHGLSVSFVKSELHKKTFINRVLFSECYWLLRLLSYWSFLCFFVFRFSFYCLHVLCYSHCIVTSHVCRDVFCTHNNNNNNNNNNAVSQQISLIFCCLQQGQWWKTCIQYKNK